MDVGATGRLGPLLPHPVGVRAVHSAYLFTEIHLRQRGCNGNRIDGIIDTERLRVGHKS